VFGLAVEVSVAHPSVPPFTSIHIPTTELVAHVTLPVAACAGAATAITLATASVTVARPTALLRLNRFIIDFILPLGACHDL
jgi:hypothetical protein